MDFYRLLPSTCSFLKPIHRWLHGSRPNRHCLFCGWYGSKNLINHSHSQCFTFVICFTPCGANSYIIVLLKQMKRTSGLMNSRALYMFYTWFTHVSHEFQHPVAENNHRVLGSEAHLPSFGFIPGFRVSPATPSLSLSISLSLYVYIYKCVYI